MPRSRGNTQLDVTMTHNVVMSTVKRNALFGCEETRQQDCHHCLNVRNVCKQEKQRCKSTFELVTTNNRLYWAVFPDEACYICNLILSVS